SKRFLTAKPSPIPKLPNRLASHQLCGQSPPLSAQIPCSSLYHATGSSARMAPSADTEEGLISSGFCLIWKPIMALRKNKPPTPMIEVGGLLLVGRIWRLNAMQDKVRIHSRKFFYRQ